MARTELTLEFGRGQTMYRNLPNGNKMTAGNKIAAITTTVPISVGNRQMRSSLPTVLLELPPGSQYAFY